MIHLTLGVVIVLVLHALSCIIVYRMGRAKGYKKGVYFVLDEWKKVLDQDIERQNKIREGRAHVDYSRRDDRVR